MKTHVKYVLLGFFFLTQLFAANYKLGGYYRSWAQSDYPPSSIPFDQVTHIFNAFAWPEKNGDLSYEYGFTNPQLVDLAHRHGVKVLVSLGGASASYGFSDMTASDAARAQFEDNIINFVRDHHYDGIDIDWEFPQDATDRINMVKLVNELRQRLDALGQGYLLTMAVPVGNWYGQWFQFDVLKNSVDWFNAMTYDFHGSWTNHSGHNAPLYSPPPAIDNCGSADDGIKYLRYQRGIPAEKIVMGLAFYGREFNASGLYKPSTGGDRTYGYADIAGLVGNGWIYHWDTVCKVPYLTNSTGTKLITYDDSASIALKCQYAKNKTLAGCMIWALGHDKIGNRQLLLQTAAEQLNIATAIDPLIAKSIPQNFRLQTFPNPFNGTLRIRFELANQARVRLTVVDAEGRQVKLLAQRAFAAGGHTLLWNAVNRASGMYFVVLRTEKGQQIKKVLLIK